MVGSNRAVKADFMIRFQHLDHVSLAFIVEGLPKMVASPCNIAEVNEKDLLLLPPLSNERLAIFSHCDEVGLTKGNSVRGAWHDVHNLPVVCRLVTMRLMPRRGDNGGSSG